MSSGPPDPRVGSPTESSALPVTLPEGLEPVRPLGRGKVAQVHLAREPELQRLVAVKILRRELSDEETARLRFEREARSAASLTHPNVVSVHRFGRLEDGTPYLVMTYVQGRTLADRIQAEGPVGEEEARSILAQLASALAAAHAKGIVHRDLRPANVLVEEDTGRALLADFGIAAVLESGGSMGPRLTRTGQIMGEPRYASPEQLRGEEVTGQADVYSLGILGYELLTGEGPYQARSAREWIAAHLTAEPRPLGRLRPGASPELEDLLLRCLAREPSHRPRAVDVLKRLEGMRRGAHGVEGIGTSPSGPGPGLVRRRVPHVVAAAAVAGWGLLELVSQLVENGILDPLLYRLSLNLVAWALVGSAVVAWFHGQKGRQKAPPLELWILAVLTAGWIATTTILLL